MRSREERAAELRSQVKIHVRVYDGHVLPSITVRLGEAVAVEQDVGWEDCAPTMRRLADDLVHLTLTLEGYDGQPDGTEARPFVRHSDGDRRYKLCRCHRCQEVGESTPRSDYYDSPRGELGYLYCENCCFCTLQELK